MKKINECQLRVTSVHCKKKTEKALSEHTLSFLSTNFRRSKYS